MTNIIDDAEPVLNATFFTAISHNEPKAPDANLGAVFLMRSTTEIGHRYIVSKPDFCGGTPVIEGTRFPVRSVVNYVLKQGLDPEALVREFPHLTLAQVYDALSYYYDHQDEIERELAENTEQALRSLETR